eukprot:TRINITY_DN4624_c0_g1_i5.p2 TRINITY_DN4624_c0_g1~~TRINITY_DN4624_c0_g1_i5.p2  ORF type:complete len:114 (+),score=5.29 TRINITY_DN4624_c0_g1_i5:193-534(+)
MDAVVSTITVDGQSIPLSKARIVCKRMFFAGCFLLPWMWIINVWYFWSDFRGQGVDPVLRKYTRWSAIGAAIVLVLFLPWMLTYMIAGEKVLGSQTWKKLDATNLNLQEYGLL